MSGQDHVTSSPLNTAILFIVFNRLETTIQVFEAIRKARPSRFYIVSDGPRMDRPGENEKVMGVRNYLNSNIDWNCNLKTLFRDSNMGCKHSVSSAIKWFFEHEEMGIILEDDCLPDQTFFHFCEELLIRYETDDRVGLISGRNNIPEDPEKSEFSYMFSHANSHNIWGWATWRRVANLYNPSNKVYFSDSLFSFLNDAICDAYEADYLARAAALAARGEVDTWDFQWVAMLLLNSQYSIISSQNLIKNIGFHEQATHTVNQDDTLALVDRSEIGFPLKHPSYIIGNRELFYRQIQYRKPTKWAEFKFKIKSIPFIMRLYRNARRLF